MFFVDTLFPSLNELIYAILTHDSSLLRQLSERLQVLDHVIQAGRVGDALTSTVLNEQMFISNVCRNHQATEVGLNMAGLQGSIRVYGYADIGTWSSIATLRLAAIATPGLAGSTQLRHFLKRIFDNENQVRLCDARRIGYAVKG